MLNLTFFFSRGLCGPGRRLGFIALKWNGIGLSISTLNRMTYGHSPLQRDWNYGILRLQTIRNWEHITLELLGIVAAIYIQFILRNVTAADLVGVLDGQWGERHC